MFGKFKRNKLKEKLHCDNNKEELQVKYIKDLIDSKKVPLIILEPLWYEMKEIIKMDQVEEYERTLNELLKERAKLTTETLEYEKAKHNLLGKVLEISQAIQEEKNTYKTSELEKVRQSILKSNEILGNNEERLKELEILIQEHNKALVKEIVSHSYFEMEKYRKQKESLEEEIEQLRQQVLIKTEQKKKCDKEFGVVYNCLHKIIGFKYIDEVDKKLGEAK
ncbi:MAG: hypothetical protein ACRC1P_00755 [Cellulosilyticaceae bacterium]